MRISGYNGLDYLNYSNRNLINSMNPNSSKPNNTNSFHSIVSQSNYYKTFGKYVINNKYNNQPTGAPNTNSAVDSTMNFVNDFDKTYNKLEATNSALKDKINASTPNTEDIVTAAQDFVKAYNDTSKLLKENSDSSTHRINTLKNSLSSIGNGNGSNYSDIGITKNADSSLTLNQDQLKEALSKDVNRTSKTLKQLTSSTEANISLSNRISKTSLINEHSNFSMNKNFGINSNSTDDSVYQNFLNVSKNSLQLRNYYFGLSSSGIFMDITI